MGVALITECPVVDIKKKDIMVGQTGLGVSIEHRVLW